MLRIKYLGGEVQSKHRGNWFWFGGFFLLLFLCFVLVLGFVVFWFLFLFFSLFVAGEVLRPVKKEPQRKGESDCKSCIP